MEDARKTIRVVLERRNDYISDFLHFVSSPAAIKYGSLFAALILGLGVLVNLMITSVGAVAGTAGESGYFGPDCICYEVSFQVVSVLGLPVHYLGLVTYYAIFPIIYVVSFLKAILSIPLSLIFFLISLPFRLIGFLTSLATSFVLYFSPIVLQLVACAVTGCLMAVTYTQHKFIGKILFGIIDKNNDGKISKDEAREACFKASIGLLALFLAFAALCAAFFGFELIRGLVLPVILCPMNLGDGLISAAWESGIYWRAVFTLSQVAAS